MDWRSSLSPNGDLRDAMAQDASGALILLYHRIGSPLVRSTVSGQYVHPALLRRQLDGLLDRGWRAGALTDILAEPASSSPRFCVTFDDGFASVGSRAYPLLRDRQVPATIFVVAGGIGRTNVWDQREGDRSEPLLDIVQLRGLAAAGIEIGSHALTHPRLTKLSDADLRAEVQDSKHLLEDQLRQPVVGFSYPYGDWDERVRQAVIDAGYCYATATTLGVARAGTDPFALPRVNVRWNAVGPILRAKIRRAYRAGEA